MDSGRRFYHLPDDLLTKHVFPKLPLSAQWAARSVCKHWRGILWNIGNLERVPEDYIIVNGSDHLLFYNVSVCRWMKPLPLASLPLSTELKNPIFCAVHQEHLFFRDHSRPPRLAIWNATTRESWVLHEVAGVPGEESYESWSDDNIDFNSLQFGAFVKKKSNGEQDLTLLVFNYLQWSGDLYRWSSSTPNHWANVPLMADAHGPNFNNRLGLVTFVDAHNWMQVYSVERGEFTQRRTLTVVEDYDRAMTLHGVGFVRNYGIQRRAVVEDYDWAMTLHGARFVMNNGIYAIGKSRSVRLNDGGRLSVGVLRVDEEEMKVVCEIPQGMFKILRRQHLFCSDGEENIWILEPDFSEMVRVNVVTGEWVSLPSILDVFPHCSLLPTSGALYTTLQ